MKYKFLKQIACEKSVHYVGDVVIDVPESKMILPDGLKVSIPELIEQGFIEEVKETPHPRWKVGNYAVCKYETLGEIDYIKIYKVNKSDKDSFYYNDEYKETCLRDPTPEELSTYFR